MKQRTKPPSELVTVELVPGVKMLTRQENAEAFVQSAVRNKRIRSELVRVSGEVVPAVSVPIALEATHLRDRRWAVRPKGQLGTCGFSPRPWTVIYVAASSAEEAIKKARK